MTGSSTHDNPSVAAATVTEKSFPVQDEMRGSTSVLGGFWYKPVPDMGRAAESDIEPVGAVEPGLQVVPISGT
jgi:hypothetical protein